MRKEITVIVAIYNIEKYLKRCLESIRCQTFLDFECILVDDGSFDSCALICDEYTVIDKRFSVIHKKNEGLPQARKTGFENASGQYLLFIDGDDWLEKNMLELMVTQAKSKNSDVVICDFYKDFGNVKKHITINFSSKKSKIMESFIKKPGYMNYFWNKLIKKELFLNNIDFPQNITLCEDLYVIFKILYYAKNVSHIAFPLYHYMQINSSAMTKNITKMSYQSKMDVLDNIIDFCAEKDDFNSEAIINFYKIYNRLPLILYKDLRNNELWTTTFPESNAYIWKVPLRLDYKILSWLCSKGKFKLAYFIQDLK